MTNKKGSVQVSGSVAGAIITGSNNIVQQAYGSGNTKQSVNVDDNYVIDQTVGDLRIVMKKRVTSIFHKGTLKLMLDQDGEVIYVDD